MIDILSHKKVRLGCFQHPLKSSGFQHRRLQNAGHSADDGVYAPRLRAFSVKKGPHLYVSPSSSPNGVNSGVLVSVFIIQSLVLDRERNEGLSQH